MVAKAAAQQLQSSAAILDTLTDKPVGCAAAVLGADSAEKNFYLYAICVGKETNLGTAVVATRQGDGSVSVQVAPPDEDSGPWVTAHFPQKYAQQVTSLQGIDTNALTEQATSARSAMTHPG